jgi:acyl transferase domain-containing protein
VSVHGTGTPLGDPIEAGALGQGLGSGGGSRKQLRSQGSGPGGRPLMLLSNKACYGHTEGTAGISGTIDNLLYPTSSGCFCSYQWCREGSI